MTFRGVPPAALAAFLPVSLALVPAPAAAGAVSVAGARAATPVAGEELGGHPIAWGMAALVAIVTAILIFSDDDEEEPFSP